MHKNRSHTPHIFKFCLFFLSLVLLFEKAFARFPGVNVQLHKIYSRRRVGHARNATIEGHMRTDRHKPPIVRRIALQVGHITLVIPPKPRKVLSSYLVSIGICRLESDIAAVTW